MFIVYYDESGDDGFPQYSSPLFVLTATYVHYSNWKESFLHLQEFRRSIKSTYGLPVKTELHIRSLLLNKHPYKLMNLSDDLRVEIIEAFCNFIATLSIRVVNVTINKPVIRSSNYDVLDKALTYSIQRVENDLSKTGLARHFMIIADEGRIGKMIRIARRMQRINYIPSKFGPFPYRKEISRLIEDPLPKRSDQSYFIQISDLVSYIVYLIKILEWKITSLPGRIPAQVDKQKLLSWLDILKPILNLEASTTDPHGIVLYPK